MFQQNLSTQWSPDCPSAFVHKYLPGFSKLFLIWQRKIIFLFFFQHYLAIQISPEQVMCFAGSTDPCAMCFLYSIGKIGDQENKVYSKLLCDLLNKQLKTPSDRRAHAATCLT
uniref:Macrophage migration inhibitory factor n=1 Tax=Strigops habroptila TaxID=2489341 RepID=A0A672URY0_STRHB